MQELQQVQGGQAVLELEDDKTELIKELLGSARVKMHIEYYSAWGSYHRPHCSKVTFFFAVKPKEEQSSPKFVIAWFTFELYEEGGLSGSDNPIHLTVDTVEVKNFFRVLPELPNVVSYELPYCNPVCLDISQGVSATHFDVYALLRAAYYCTHMRRRESKENTEKELLRELAGRICGMSVRMFDGINERIPFQGEPEKPVT